MRPRVLVNLVLAVGVGTLAAFLVLNKPAEKAAPEKPLTSIPEDGIQEIRVHRAHGPDMAFQREQGNWIMTAPVQVPAYASRMGAILGLLSEPTRDSLPVKPDQLPRFKLDAPEVTLTLDKHEFDFGDTEPLERRRYVRYGDTVYLVADTLYYQLRQNPGYFVDPSLLPADSEVREIDFPDFTLREDKGKWTREPDDGSKPDKLHSAVLDWESARAITVRTPIEGDAVGRVLVQMRQGPALHFDILSAGDNVVLARADLNLEYHLDSYTAEQLLLKKPAPALPGETPPPSP